MSELHDFVDDWLRSAGARIAADAQPDAVRTHLRGCAACREAMDAIAETRAWFPEPTMASSDHAIDAIRFRLEAEARSARAPKLPSAEAPALRSSDAPDSHGSVAPSALTAQATGARRRPRAALWLAAAAMLLLAGLAFAATRSSNMSPRAPRALPQATPRRVVVSRTDAPADVRVVAVAAHAVTERDDTERDVAARELARSRRAPAPSGAPQSAARGGAGGAPTPGVAHARAGSDEAFAEAWQLFDDGRPDAAAFAFDALLADDLGEREADVLYWSARAHLGAHRAGRARERLDELLARHPGSWHAAEARTLRARLGAEP